MENDRNASQSPDKSRALLNEFLTDVFHHILKFEEYALWQQGEGDLSIQEMHLIEKLGPDRELRMSQVANALGVTLGTMTVAADRLDKKGYVTRQRIDDDRRVVKLRLTDKGKEAFKAHAEFHMKMVEMILQGITPIDEQTLVTALMNLRDFLKAWITGSSRRKGGPERKPRRRRSR